MKKLFLAAISLIFSLSAQAQTWSEGFVLGGSGNNKGSFFARPLADFEIIGGTFEKKLDPPFDLPNAIGDRDIFLATFSNGELENAIAMGGPYPDNLLAAGAYGDGSVVLAGQYIVEAQLDTHLFVSDPLPSAVYFARFNRDLQVEWHFQVGSNGLLDVAKIIPGSEGELYITGSFQDTLWWQDTVLTSIGNQDVFIANLDSGGNLNWIRHFGASGDTRASTMTENKGSLLVAGIFNDRTSFGGAGMTANTKDLDVFLLSLDAEEGEVSWAVKAGGVFDEEVSQLLVDEDGNIYAFGQFIGVMNTGLSESIQSSTGQSDLFLLKYDSLGAPLMAIAFNAPGPQLASDLKIQGDNLILCGYFQNSLSLPPLNSLFSQEFHGYVAAIDKNDFTPEWILELTGDEGVYPEQLLIGTNDIQVLGNFSGKLQAGQIQLEAIGFSDLFLAGIEFSTTSIRKTDWLQFELFPNPAAEQVNIRTPYPEAILELFDGRFSKLIERRINYNTTLEVAHLPAGQYWIVLRTQSGYGVSPVILKP